jgi:hypothetical protein
VHGVHQLLVRQCREPCFDLWIMQREKAEAFPAIEPRQSTYLPAAKMAVAVENDDGGIGIISWFWQCRHDRFVPFSISLPGKIAGTMLPEECALT